MELKGYRRSLDQVPKQIGKKKYGGVGNKRSGIGES